MIGGYGYSPFQPNYQYQPQTPRPFVGRWEFVDSYQQIQNAPLPIDGSKVLFMLSNEPVFYIASMENGQRSVIGYSFTALAQAQTVEPPMTLESRVSAIEQRLQAMLNGGNNEPDIHNDETATSAAGNVR